VKKILLLSIILLVSATWVVAQSGTTPSPNYPNGPSSSDQMGGQSSQGGQDSQGMSGQGSQGARSQTSPNDNGSGNPTQIEGCLAGSSGAYTLTDASGNTWQLQGGDAQLSKHVGESVRINGTPAGSASSSGGSAGMAGQNFSVGRVRKISNTCNNAGSAPSK